MATKKESIAVGDTITHKDGRRAKVTRVYAAGTVEDETGKKGGVKYGVRVSPTDAVRAEVSGIWDHADVSPVAEDTEALPEAPAAEEAPAAKADAPAGE